MTERDKRRARIGRMIGYLDSIDKQDLRDELEASERDRKALVEARELLSDWLCGLRPRKKIDAFLKRTEPTDE